MASASGDGVGGAVGPTKVTKVEKMWWCYVETWKEQVAIDRALEETKVRDAKARGEIYSRGRPSPEILYAEVMEKANVDKKNNDDHNH